MAGALGRPGLLDCAAFAVERVPPAAPPVSARTAGPCSSRRPTGSRHASAVARRSRRHDFLRPSYDMFGDLWLVDRTAPGARVLVRPATTRCVRSRSRASPVRDVAAFSVARDGSRLAVAYAGNPAPPVRVTDILRTDEGIVSGAGRSQHLRRRRPDAARLVDIGWRDPSTLAVLSRTCVETSKVSFVSFDGSPASPGPHRADGVPRRRRGDGRGPGPRPAAAPDHSRPAALHAEQQRQLAADRAPRWRRRRTYADRL